VEPQQTARDRVVDFRRRSGESGAHAPNPESPASAAPIPAAPGLHDRWNKRPLALSRTRGRPVPAEMLPALSPQPSQVRTTGRVSALAGSGIVVVVVIGSLPFGLGLGVCLPASPGPFLYRGYVDT